MESGFNWRRREEGLEALDKEFDVIVVGGGINGCAVANETARRGQRVLLLEKGDIGSGTSGRSSRLIHGGLRYLKHGQVKVVWDGCRERHWLRTHYPYLVRPVRFIIPFYEGEGEGPVLTFLGLWIYDLLSAFRNVSRHRRLRRGEVLAEEPRLRSGGLQGGAVYYDCMTDDFRLVLLNAAMANAAGAYVLSHCRVEAPTLENDRVVGVQFTDLLSGEPHSARGRIVINTTGPWSDLIRVGIGAAEPMLRPTKGVHLIVPREKVGNRNAVVIRSPTDGRVLFTLPWGKHTIIGTTDTDFPGDPDEVQVEGWDVDYLLEAVNGAFPRTELRRSDVVSTYAALRPLVGRQGVSEGEVSRDFKIVEDAPGLVSILGGKLTTYRPSTLRVADIVSRIVSRRPDKMRRGTGTRRGIPEEDILGIKKEAAQRAAQLGLDQEVAGSLVASYGPHSGSILELASQGDLRRRIVPDLPRIMAEIVYSVESEMALRLEDVLVRRTRLFYEDTGHGLGVAKEVAELMAARTGWSDERVQREVDDYRGLVESMRASLEGG